MKKIPDFVTRYRKLAGRLMWTHRRARAMSLAVGGDFEAVGWLEYFLLLQHGLQPAHTLVDVGCGSGRLAMPLRDYLTGKYIGIDVVPELYKHAEKICGRPDWKFYEAPGLTIPEPDNSVDFICFFSVFTHLAHEQSFKYLRDARRVLKPGGKIVISFLEFSIPSHWFAFQDQIDNTNPEKVLNQFISRDAIAAWCSRLDLALLALIDGDKPHIPLAKPVRWDNGNEMREIGNLGQSVCILGKPRPAVGR